MRKTVWRISLLGLFLASSACYLDTAFIASDLDNVVFDRSEPFQDESELEADIQLPIGEVRIGAGDADQLFELELRYPQKRYNPRLDFSRESEAARLDFSLEGESPSIRGSGRVELQVRFHPETPITLRTEAGVGSNDIDLTGLQVKSFHMEAGVGETSVSVYEPNRVDCERVTIRNGVGELTMNGLGFLGFREFVFQGGVGAAELDFSGNWERVGLVSIHVGVGEVSIVLPRTIGARIRASKSFLSSLELEGFEKRGRDHHSYNIDEVEQVVEMDIKAGIGAVSVTWK